MSYYIHFGSDKFDPERFCTVTNYLNKPKGGLWGSPVDSKESWEHWCKKEEFALDRLSASFRFQLTPAARVCHLYTSKDIILLPILTHLFDTLVPDYEGMLREGWDAVELHFTDSDAKLFQMFRSWSCDSILVLNPKVIMPL